MFIKYNESNVHALPHIKTKQVRLKNKKTGKIRFETRLATDLAPQDIKWLRPGWNDFPKEVWDQHKDNVGIKAMLKAKKIELLEEKVKVKEGKKMVTKIIGIDDSEVNVKDFSESRAIEIVKDTLNRDILQRWLDEETRHKVKRILVKQIKPLLSEETSDDDED